VGYRLLRQKVEIFWRHRKNDSISHDLESLPRKFFKEIKELGKFLRQLFLNLGENIKGEV